MQLGLQVEDRQKPGAGPFGVGVACEVWSNELAPTGGLGKGAIRG